MNPTRKTDPSAKIWIRVLVTAVSAVVVAAVVAHSARKPSPVSREVHDGFDGRQLSSLWRTDKLVEGALGFQKDVVRSGHGALKVTIRSRDKFSAADSIGNRSSQANERDELQEINALQAHEGEGWAYSFSLHVPKDFPVVPTRLVLAQWKHRDDRGSALRDNPVIALRYEGGVLSISSQTGPTKKTLYRTKDEIRGRWVDFVFHIRFSRHPDGLLRVWMDGANVLSLQGPTTYGEDQGYSLKSNTFYFKMGLYRDAMAEPMTVYFDEYRKRPLSPTEQP